jgi:hypothetical protein
MKIDEVKIDNLRRLRSFSKIIQFHFQNMKKNFDKENDDKTVKAGKKNIIYDDVNDDDNTQ